MSLDLLFAAPIGALVIGLLRVADVSMAMTRMLLAVRGHRIAAAGIGFFEVLIWLVAVGKAIEHMHSPLHVVGYATGFAAGNYVGIWLEERFALGTNVVHAVIRRSAESISKDARAVAAAQRLRTGGFAVTELEGLGLHSSVDILNVVVARRSVPAVVHLIRSEDPEAFVSVEEVRSVQGGYLGPAGRKMPSLAHLNLWRKRSKSGVSDPAHAAVPVGGIGTVVASSGISVPHAQDGANGLVYSDGDARQPPEALTPAANAC